MSNFTIVGLGEILWDVFPTYKQLGGAPTNFAYISSLLGDHAVVASRIGTDDLGTAVVDRLNSLQLSTSHLQRDLEHPTGTVQIELDSTGQASFDFTAEVAWDFLAWDAAWEQLAQSTDAVCFGTLAQRSPQSRVTIQRFLRATPSSAIRIFDINLRQSFYSSEVLSESAERADILKLNHEEVLPLMTLLGEHFVDDDAAAAWLCEQFELKLVCITRGSNGSLLVNQEARDEHPGYPVEVADTVGAGDAFTATLVHHYLRGSSLATMNDAANRMGSWVASKPGATPAAEPEFIDAARAVRD
ncbi:sugar kinase, ribokinase family [Candidatus Koribacter versatilis Ellin345]|uniref:Sugar kinase, ribokinase family n=1 Tax=Koribacter versatilis (strain Ellin345) TaxID=204669 RepID=Q1ISU3_KORVE|nr:carbohydrate kinase [Candidatus Koribacter versatilis]ABF40057.1 sugar kinase, ribokinase family [Candidatus Koribacter versatilis Ellin345]